MFILKPLQLVLIVTCGILIAAYDITADLQPAGQLGVTLDRSFALNWPTTTQPNDQVPRNWMYSSHLTFTQPVATITDGQLWQIAIDAYNEMQAARTQYGIGRRNRCTALSVMAWGNEIILGSTQKGGNSFTYGLQTTQVLEDLQLCEQVWGEFVVPDEANANGHRMEGKCAEPMTCQVYYTRDNMPHIATQNARIGTVVEQNGIPVPTIPCPTDLNDQDTIWGCNLFVVSQGFTVIDTATPPAPYNLGTIAGGNPARDQIQLCGDIRQL